jgi:hypothetical protein
MRVAKYEMTIIDGGCRKSYALSRQRDRRETRAHCEEASRLFRERAFENHFVRHRALPGIRIAYNRSGVRISPCEVQEHSPLKIKVARRWRRWIPPHVPTVRQITDSQALGLVHGAGNPNPEPLHMRLKRRALHAQ